tara:strand:- start:343 stop:747 length:405 start_codon:yes stop_codon:yes gene_type:complete
MNDLRKAAGEALEALEDVPYMSNKDDYERLERVKTALRQALETEPFEYWNAVEGWVKIDEVRQHFESVGCGTIYKSAGEGRSPLYTAPPKQWVGLTDAEKSDLWCESTGRDSVNEDTHVFADAIEAKLREKNNG